MNSLQNKKFDTFKMIFRQIGGLLIILGYSMVVPLLMSLIYSELYSALGFFISGLICLSTGFLLYKGFKSSSEPLNRHALIIAAAGWLSLAIMGALPYIIIAFITPIEVSNQFRTIGADYVSSLYYFKNPIHAIFDSMSGFTTTGLSMAIHEPSIGKGLLFYRHFTQLLGGAGFIVLTLSVMGQSSSRISNHLYSAESSGERLKSTITETARIIWKVYIGLTLFLFVFLVVGTLILLPNYGFTDNLFDSINHAMAGMSTGGFSTLDDSIAGYHSQGMEILYLFPMIVGTLSLPFYVKVIYNKQYSQLWNDIQTRSLLILFILGSLALSFILLLSGLVSEPFRIGVFQFVSALSTTGWQTCDVHTWDSASILFIVIFGMIIGGALGATVGGIKIFRVLVLLKGLFWRINSYFSSENSIKVVRFNNTRLLPEEMNKEIASTATFVFIYLILLGVGTIIGYYTAGQGFTMKDALFESASAQGTVGLSCGISNPDMNPVLEITYIIQMWMGRLEIIPILILFRTILLGTKPKVV